MQGTLEKYLIKILLPVTYIEVSLTITQLTDTSGMKLPDYIEETSPGEVYQQTQEQVYGLTLTQPQLQLLIADINPTLSNFLTSYINSSEVSSDSERTRHLEQALMREAAEAIIFPTRLGIDLTKQVKPLEQRSNNIRTIRRNNPTQFALPAPRLARIP